MLQFGKMLIDAICNAWFTPVGYEQMQTELIKLRRRRVRWWKKIK
jgi:hypothetical protein